MWIRLLTNIFMKIYKFFLLYVVFPLIPVITYFLGEDHIPIGKFLILYLIAFLINGIFMRMIGEKLFTYNKNKEKE